MKLRQTLTWVWSASARLQIISALCLTFMCVAPGTAQDDAPAAENRTANTADESADESADNTPKDPETLRDDAQAISGRYERFERLLSQMADLMAVEDPDRAELLRRACFVDPIA